MSKAAAAIAPQDASKLREWIPAFLATFNGMDEIGEPYLTWFKDVKLQMNSVLEKLPLNDAIPAGQEAGWYLNSLLSAFTNLQAMHTFTGARLKELSAKNSEADPKLVQAAIDKAIDEQVTAGELVKKDMHLSLCSNAKIEGETAGEKKVRDELAQQEQTMKTIATRKELVSKNGLPLPAEDAALEGTDEEFTARTETAKKRVELLKGHKVALNSPVMPYVWGSERDFSIAEKSVMAQRGAAASGKPAEPFAKPPVTEAALKKAGAFIL